MRATFRRVVGAIERLARSLGVVVNGSLNRLNPIPVRALAAGQAGASYLVRL